MQPKWQTLIRPTPQRKRTDTQFTVFEPRLWTSDKEELLAILPELCGSKCVNGISWLLYENPMMILDDTTYFFETTKVDDLTIDLTTTRSFTCPASSTIVPDIDEASFNMSPLQTPAEDVTMESVPIIRDPPSSNHGTDPFDLDGHCIPPCPVMREEPPSIIRHTPPSVGFHASPVIKQQRDPLIQQFAYSVVCGTASSRNNPCWGILVDQLVKLILQHKFEENHPFIDGLDANAVGELVSILARALGFSLDNIELSGYPGGIDEYNTTCHQKLQEKMHWQDAEMSTASSFNFVNNGRTGSVGNSNTSEMADREQDLRPLVDVSIQDSNPLPRDALLLQVPSPIPQEIQALIDAYIFGQPLTVIVSNERLYEHWGLHLPIEYGYVIMGYYRIIGVEEYQVQSPEPKVTSKGFISGRVRWRFRIRWSAGGEECIWQDRTDVLEHPWWSPADRSPADGSSSAVDLQPNEPEDLFPTTPYYRDLRKRNHEYQFRHDPLQDFFNYIFPPHLLMPFTALLPDANFPRGWICQKCGRMNFQRSLRRRKCSSSLCKNSNTISYFLDLFLLRDPQDRLTLPLPYSTYPEDGVKVGHARWDDGIQTFSCLMPDENKTTCYIKHVFTGNLAHLQSYAQDWLRNIQLELDIVRKPGDNGPYFGYSAKVRNRICPDQRRWPEVPDCLINMKDRMVSRAKLYAQERNIRIDQVDILAWVTSGSKKHPVPIKATNKAVVLLCLGCNITLIVTPRAKKTSPIAEADDVEENPHGHAGWISGEFGDDPPLTHSASPKKQATTSKKEKFSFSLSLVHGDILVFFGDEFEYTIKRHGTSFLLMGSSIDSMQDERAREDSSMRMTP